LSCFCGERGGDGWWEEVVDEKEDEWIESIGKGNLNCDLKFLYQLSFSPTMQYANDGLDGI
jgi:hypothetical protein